MKNNYAPTVFWLTVASIFIIGYFLLSAQEITRASKIKNTGTYISAEKKEDIPEINIDIIHQNDSKWEMKIMCDDVYMRFLEYGSQITCASSVMRLYGIHETPDSLYDIFVDKGIYSYNESEVFSHIKYEFTPSKYNSVYKSPKINSPNVFDSETICKLLASSTPVMVRVTHSSIERFWVVIVGVKDGEFIIMDPLSDTLSTLSVYHNQVYQIMYFTQDK